MFVVCAGGKAEEEEDGTSVIKIRIAL